MVCSLEFANQAGNPYLSLMLTDPIADMLTRIRNAQMVKKASVQVPSSKLKKAIAELLKKEGYIEDVHAEVGIKSMMTLRLKYIQGKPAIQSIARVSKPGHRTYTKADELPRVLNGYGIAIVSTSAGIMTNKEAKEKGIGGEILCSVY